MPHPALKLAAARSVLELADSVTLIGAAHAALNDGVYARGLGELITAQDLFTFDAARWFADALAELGAEPPDRAEAMRVILEHHLRPVAERTVDPVIATSDLIREFDCFFLEWRPLPSLDPGTGEVVEMMHLECVERAYGEAGYERPASEVAMWSARAVGIARDWLAARPFDPAWRTPTVVDLARGITAGRRFDLLPVLADALEEAGCGDLGVLGHCRASGPHADWCWVVAAIGAE